MARGNRRGRVDSFHCFGTFITEKTPNYSSAEICHKLYLLLKDYVEDYYVGTFINEQAV